MHPPAELVRPPRAMAAGTDWSSGDGEAGCRIASGTFATIVQIFLAAAGVSTLLFKRWRESPRRSWLVWFFDASKQAFSGVLMHGINVIFGLLFAAGSRASECSWYFVNFTISIIGGLFVLMLIMAAHRNMVERWGLVALRSGEYGTPPSWRPWLAQLLLWGVYSCLEKAVTGLCVILPLKSSLDGFAVWIEGPYATSRGSSSCL